METNIFELIRQSIINQIKSNKETQKSNESIILNNISLETLDTESTNILSNLFFEQQKTKAVDRKVGGLLIQPYEIEFLPGINEIGYEIIEQSHNQMWTDFGYECEYENGQSKEFVIHAEEDIIFKNEITTKNLTKWEPIKKRRYELIMLTTLAPCMNCARLIKRAGIDTVIFLEKHKWKFDFKTSDLSKSKYYCKTSPEKFLLDSNINVIHLKMN